MSVQQSQEGFTAAIVALFVAIIGVGGLVVWRVVDSNMNQVASQKTNSENAVQTSSEDLTILTKAKELKKIDFDLDGTINSLDNDDDNDGTNDDVDNDDDNDGTNDDVDNDDDNDGVDNELDDENEQQDGLRESRDSESQDISD